MEGSNPPDKRVFVQDQGGEREPLGRSDEDRTGLGQRSLVSCGNDKAGATEFMPPYLGHVLVGTEQAYLKNQVGVLFSRA